jgi:hypothetical protein
MLRCMLGAAMENIEEVSVRQPRNDILPSPAGIEHIL